MAPSWRFNVPSVILWEIQVTTNGLLWGRSVISCFRGAGGLSSHSLLTVPKLTATTVPQCFCVYAEVWSFEAPLLSFLFNKKNTEFTSSC